MTFDFKVQFYIDETRTPVEDRVVEWKESDSPFMTVAKLVIPQQDMDSKDARATESMIERLAFNPWNAPGNFGRSAAFRARLRVYRASVQVAGDNDGSQHCPRCSPPLALTQELMCRACPTAFP